MNRILKIKPEKYVPRMETNLIPKRIKTLSKVDYKVSRFVEEQVALEDAVKGANMPSGELRILDIPPVSRSLHESIWGLISQLTP